MTRPPLPLVPAVTLAALVALSACTPVATGARSSLGDFASADDSVQLELLRASEDAVAAEIRAAAPDAAAAFGVARRDSSQLVFRDITSIVEAAGDVLRSDKGGATDQGRLGWSDGREAEWSLEPGHVRGTYVYESGDVSSGSRFTLTVCPDASGTFSGNTQLKGTSGSIGWDIVIAFEGQVGDGAYADDMLVETAGTLDAGGWTQDAAPTVGIAFGAAGTRSVAGEPPVGGASTSWDRAVEDLAVKTAMRLARELEDYWRSRACVEVGTDPESTAEVEPAGRLTVAPLPESKVDGVPITTGTVAGELTSGGGRFAPAGTQPVGTTFEYGAPSSPGSATVAFTATSRRGIGFGELEIAIGGGWTFTETYTTVTSTALKCGGLTGEWTMASTAPWAYQATTTWTFGEDLRAATTIVGTAGGIGFSGSNEVWIETDSDGNYELHASDGPNVFYLVPAPPGSCG